MLCFSLLQTGSIPKILSFFLQNATQQEKSAVILSSAWTPEFQRMNLAYNLKLCGMKRKGESSDGETKKPGCSQLKKCEEREETGAEERNRRASFYSKGAIFTAEIREADCIWWRNWGPLIHRRSHELQWGSSRDHWPKPTEHSRTVNSSTELHTHAVLILPQSVCFLHWWEWRMTAFSVLCKVWGILHFGPSLKE